LLWHDPQAGELANLNAHDKFAGWRYAINHIAQEHEEWAGIPMPLEDQELVIEPNYPRAEALMEIGRKDEETEVDRKYAGYKIRNRFYSRKLGRDVVIFESPDGKVDWGAGPTIHNLNRDITSLGCSVAWGIEQEARAVRTLAGLLRHHQFKQYLLVGMFLETSRRSGLTYLFRKLRPTVVLDIRDKGARDTRIVCALCLHPIAYYANTWAGAMTPTDDVIAHLMLMRGDEHMFWRRANQHAPHTLEAGLR
jgi:hypothetical protein